MPPRKAKTEAGTSGEIRIEYFPLDVIARWPRNPKLHADAAIDESLERFGFVAPAIRDERTKRLVAGHGRLDRLVAWQNQGKPAPKRIVVRPDDSAWLMPVVCGVSFDDDREAEAYLLADNQITMLRGYDAPKLKAIADDLLAGPGLIGTGFDEESIRAQMEQRVGEALGGEGLGDDHEPALLDGEAVDDGPEVTPSEALRQKWETDVGQFWEITSADGQRTHRLAVGDSTDPERILKLMNGAKARMLMTDPPYGVDYSAVKNGIPRSGFSDHTEQWGHIKDDNLDDAGLADLMDRLWGAIRPHLHEDAAVYVWHPAGARSVAFVQFFQRNKLVLHRSIVWVKPGFVLTRSGMYHWAHEPCLYGWQQGHQPPWHGPKNQRSVWPVGRDEDSGMHPTSKPAELWAIAMRNHLLPGEAAFDFCAGSGPNFIAAESLGCIAYGCEIEPRYAAVILERMTQRGCRATLMP